MEFYYTISGLPIIAFFGLWFYDLKTTYQATGKQDFKKEPIFKATLMSLAIVFSSLLLVISGLPSSLLANADVFFIYLFSISISLFVSFFWFQYINKLDIFEQEKSWVLACVFFCGAALFILSLPISKTYVGEDSNSFLYSIIVLGLTQEFLKLLPVIILAKFTKIINEPFDYLLYGSVSALGFAFVENSFYLFHSEFDSFSGHTLYSSPLQMVFTSVICYYWAMASHFNKKSTFQNVLIAFIAIIILHGCYHFVLLSKFENDLWILTLVFLLIALKIWIKMVNNLINISALFNAKPNFNIQKYKYRLSIYVVSAIAFTYLAKCLVFGTSEANRLLLNSAYEYSFIMAFVGINFSSVNIIQGYVPPLYKGLGFSLETILPTIANKKNCSNSRVRLFFPPGIFVRDYGLQLEPLLPIKGTILRKVVYGERTDFYLFTPDSPIKIGSFLRTHFLILSKNEDRPLCSKNSVLAELYGLSNKANIELSVFEKNKAKKIHLIRCKGLTSIKSK